MMAMIATVLSVLHHNDWLTISLLFCPITKSPITPSKLRLHHHVRQLHRKTSDTQDDSPHQSDTQLKTPNTGFGVLGEELKVVVSARSVDVAV